MTIENYIQAGLQHLGVYSESISDIIYFMALLVIIGIINWIIHVLTRQWLARIVLKLTKRTATNWDDLMLDQRFFNRLGLLIAPIVIQIVFKEFEWTQFTFLMKLINVWITLSFLLIVSSIRQLPDGQGPPYQGIHPSDQDIFLLCRHHHRDQHIDR